MDSGRMDRRRSTPRWFLLVLCASAGACAQEARAPLDLAPADLAAPGDLATVRDLAATGDQATPSPDGAAPADAAAVLDGTVVDLTPPTDLLACAQPAEAPGPKYGGMSYVNTTYDTTAVFSVEHHLCFVNDPGNAQGLYFQTYDFAVDGEGTYHGLQVDSLGRRAIFSRFGTTDLGNVRLGPGANQFAGTNEGPYVRILSPYAWTAGCYTVRVSRAEAQGERDWFDMYVSRDGDASPTYIGGIRFDRQTPGVPARLANGGGTWIEAYSAVPSVFDIPYAHITVTSTANLGAAAALHAVGIYNSDGRDNCDTSYDPASKLIHMTVGAHTPRCHAAGPLF